MTPYEILLKDELDCRLAAMEAAWEADVLAIVSPILSGLEHKVRDALERVPAGTRRERLVVVLQTNGGSVEVVERMVTVIRALYPEVWMAVPDKAMSAGTVFAMAADEIFMDGFSVLGPIDPQVPRKIDGETKFVPCLAYTLQYERFIKKAQAGDLTSAEFALLQKMDLAELQQFEDQRELSVDLLKAWLTRYKFKNWNVTETAGHPVSLLTKQARAEEIARKLNNPQRWHSHERGISIQVLTSPLPEGLNLRIRDLAGEPPEFSASLATYYGALIDVLTRLGALSFVHNRVYY